MSLIKIPVTVSVLYCIADECHDSVHVYQIVHYNVVHMYMYVIVTHLSALSLIMSILMTLLFVDKKVCCQYLQILTIKYHSSKEPRYESNLV